MMKDLDNYNQNTGMSNETAIEEFCPKYGDALLNKQKRSEQDLQ